tara:strand:+ start:348 stop:2357 length:2010 start_codon:yes stop_codon:yes gene_type:complete
MTWQSLLLKAITNLPEGKEGVKTQLMSKSLMDMFEKFVDTGPTKKTLQAIKAIDEIKSDLTKAGRVLSNVDYLKEMFDPEPDSKGNKRTGVITRRDLSENLETLWRIRDKLDKIRGQHTAASSMKTNWEELLKDLSEDKWKKLKGKPTAKKPLLQQLWVGLTNEEKRKEHNQDLRTDYKHLIDDLVDLGFHEIIYTVETDNDEAMGHFNSNANEGKYKEGKYNWYRYAPFTANVNRRMDDEKARLREHHPSTSDIKSIKARPSPITKIFRLAFHAEEVSGKLQRKTSAKKYKMESLTDEKNKDFLIHILELEPKFITLNQFSPKTLKNFKIAGIIRTKGDNRIDFLHNYVDLLFDISGSVSETEKKIADILEELEDMKLTTDHYKMVWAAQYAKDIKGNKNILNVSDYKNAYSEDDRKDIETEMAGSDFLKDKKSKYKKIINEKIGINRIEDQFIEEDGEYTLSPAAKIAFKSLIDRGIEEDAVEDIDINEPFDDNTRRDIINLFDDDDEDEEWKKLAQEAEKNLSSIPFDDSGFTSPLEKKLAGIIYHLLAQNKPVKETMIGGTSEVFKFFKMVYNTLGGFAEDDRYVKKIDELLSAIKGGDFDFDDPPYVEEIKELAKWFEFNIAQIKALFEDNIIKPSLKELITHPYEYRDETIQKLIEKNIISEV